MASRTKKPSAEPQSIPDKDKYTGGQPRDKSNTDRARRQSDNHDRDEAAVAKGDHVGKGKWKADDEPPYARTYDEPLDEDGAYEA